MCDNSEYIIRIPYGVKLSRVFLFMLMLVHDNHSHDEETNIDLQWNACVIYVALLILN